MKIPYGISNFETLVKEGYYFVDKTKYIEILENIFERFIMYLRPRRFGKSLFVSLLSYYYDIKEKENFNNLFGKFDVSRKPTQNANAYMILQFDFSGIDTRDFDSTYSGFRENVLISTEFFINSYFHDKLFIAELKTTKETDKIIKKLFNYVKSNSSEKIYLLIDEYDHFANEILAFNPKEFETIFATNGFVRKFYEELKTATRMGVVDRMFITGVTSLALDSLTSGFNIAANLSRNFELYEMIGFNDDEIRAIIDGICQNVDCDKGKLYNDLQDYYNGYLLTPEAHRRIFNSDMILYFAKEFIRNNGRYPNNMLDMNILSDYGKIKQIFKIGDYTKNLEQLDKLVVDGYVTGSIKDHLSYSSFGQNDFINILFYMGLITIHSGMGFRYKFCIPNMVIENLYKEFFIDTINERLDLSYDTAIVANAIDKMAFEGDISDFISIVQNILETFSNRDFQKFNEKYIKTIILSILAFYRGYITKSEYEVDTGYIDIYIKRNEQFPDIKYSYLLELKYLRKADSREITSTEQQATAQLKRYIQNHELENVRYLKKYIVIFAAKQLKVVQEVN